MAIVLGADPLTADELLAIADGERVTLSPAARTRMTVARSVLEQALEAGDAVYGLTRRLGAGHGDEVADQGAFQRQVLRNHRADIGDPVQATVVRAAMAARLAHLAAGGAGVRPVVAEALVSLLNRGIVPLVRDRGSVGAADLVQNAAVAAVLVGEGAVLGDDGSITPGAEALAAAGIAPLEPAAHEALSLINTNAFAIASAAVLGSRLETLTEAADLAVACSLEAAAAHRASGGLGPFSAVVHEDAAEDGRALSAGRIREALAGSFLEEPDRERAVQDELSFRCAPQVHGAIGDTAADLLDAVDAELAVRPENPLVDPATGTITPNGNFAPVGLALDLERARVALAHLGAVAERRIAVLSGLAAPLRAADAAGIPGLLAYTAAAAAAQLRALAAPVTLGGAPLSVVEDYATFAWTAAEAGQRSADLVLEILAIEALHAASLVRGRTLRLGAGTAPVLDRLVALLDAAPPAEDLVLSAAAVLAS
ncbi:MAG TPA: aromatic amino acid lyase [Amnibacterium sp.]